MSPPLAGPLTILPDHQKGLNHRTPCNDLHNCKLRLIKDGMHN